MLGLFVFASATAILSAWDISAQNKIALRILETDHNTTMNNVASLGKVNADHFIGVSSNFTYIRRQLDELQRSFVMFEK